MNSTDAIAMLDKNNCVIDINDRFTELFGYKLEDIIGENLDDIIGNEDVVFNQSA